MHEKLAFLLDKVTNDVTIYALSAAFLAHELPDVNWLGFYLAADDGLILGPFQGLPACIHIPYGRGACGRVANSKIPLIIGDVRKEANYIACHAETRSELVLPIVKNGTLVAVLDIDSLSLNRFSKDDLFRLQACSEVIQKALNH